MDQSLKSPQRHSRAKRKPPTPLSNRSFPLTRVTSVEGLRCEGPTLTSRELLRLKKVLEDTRSSSDFKHLARRLAIASGKVRFLILFALKQHPLCVCDLAIILSDTVSNVSHQLKVLRQEGWITFQRMGRAVEYRLTPAGEEILRCLTLMSPMGKVSKGSGVQGKVKRAVFSQSLKPSLSRKG